MNTELLNQVKAKYGKKNPPAPKTGDTVRVYQKIVEGEKHRVQVFEGLVIATKHGSQMGASFTVRKIGAASIGIERTFPVHSPNIVKVEKIKSAKVKRAKLYYLRGMKASALRLKGEKPTKQVWEEPEAEKELEKIKEEQAEEAEQKAEEKEKEEEEIEKTLEDVKAKHEEVK